MRVDFDIAPIGKVQYSVVLVVGVRVILFLRENASLFAFHHHYDL